MLIPLGAHGALRLAALLAEAERLTMPVGETPVGESRHDRTRRCRRSLSVHHTRATWGGSSGDTVCCTRLSSAGTSPSKDWWPR